MAVRLRVPFVLDSGQTYHQSKRVFRPWPGDQNDSLASPGRSGKDKRSFCYIFRTPGRKKTVCGFAELALGGFRRLSIEWQVSTTSEVVGMSVRGIALGGLAGAAPDQDQVTVHLREGWNKVFAKVADAYGDSGLYLRFADPARDLRYSAAPRAATN